MNPSSKFRSIFTGSIFLLFFALIYLVFRNGALDEWFTNQFYAGPGDPSWPLESQLWVQIAYKGGSVLTVVWGVSTIVVFILGFWIQKLRLYRMLSILCFLVLAIGPGLIVNSIFKDNWGRPRPRETQAFGGEAEYQAPFIISDVGGKSFPCGHCSVGFALCAFAFWNLRAGKRRRWTLWWWWIAMGAGGYLGLARIAVGAHYLSDVLTSGLVVILITWLFDILLLKKRVSIDLQEAINDGNSEKKPIWLIVASGLVAIIFAATALIAFPYHDSGQILLNELNSPVPLRWNDEDASLSSNVRVVSSDANLKIAPHLFVSLGDLKDGSLKYDANGFGFPWSHVEVVGEFTSATDADGLELRFQLNESGFFNELKVELLLED